MGQQQSRFDVIFAEGRKRYEQNTGQRCDAGIFATMTTVSDVRAHIQQENNKFDSFRIRHNTVYSRLSAAFTPVERLGSLVATASSAGCPPAGVCLGAVALLIKSAQDVSSHYDSILDLFDTLAVRHCRVYSTLSDIPRASCLASSSTTLNKLALNSKRTLPMYSLPYSRLLAILRKLSLGEGRKYTQLGCSMAKIRRLCICASGSKGWCKTAPHLLWNTSTAMSKSTTAVVVDGIQVKTNTIVTEITDLKGNSRLDMDFLQKQHQNQCDNDIYNILRPLQRNTDKMEGFLRDRVACTGNWLFFEPYFQSWLRRSRLREELPRERHNISSSIELNGSS
jgi:hypothetical protein